MRTVSWRLAAWLAFALMVLTLVPGVVEGLPPGAASSLTEIPGPQPAAARPRLYAGYGAFIGAGLLGLLYLYRGRAFILYWIAGWLMIGVSMLARSLGGDPAPTGGFALNAGALSSVWAAAFFMLAPAAFPSRAIPWAASVTAAGVSAVWFLGAPFVLPQRIVLGTAYLAATVLLFNAAFEYFRLARRTGYVGAYVISVATLAVAFTNLGDAGLMLNLMTGPQYINTLLGFSFVMNILAALGMHVVVVEDMTEELRATNRELAAANEEVRRLAITDPLTGCYNRRFFEEIERRELLRHRRYQSPLSVVFTDINRFKHVNDTLGHDTGDAVLRSIGGLLRAHVRETDYVFRWGGDEFLLLLACTTAQAEWKASELKQALQTDPVAAGLPGSLGLSIGVADVPLDAESLAAAIAEADERMYLDKSHGRPLVVGVGG